MKKSIKPKKLTPVQKLIKGLKLKPDPKPINLKLFIEKLTSNK